MTDSGPIEVIHDGVPHKPVRESHIVRGIGLGGAVWGLCFALTVAFFGENLTSPQWVYLMSIPGGPSTWAIIFGAGSMAIVAGLKTAHYNIAAFGMAIIAVACTSVGGFYLLAPLANKELFTLGYFPWILCAAHFIVGTRINFGKTPVDWF